MTTTLEQISVYGFKQSTDAGAFKAFGMTLDAMSEQELLGLSKLLEGQLNTVRPKEANPPIINCWARE